MKDSILKVEGVGKAYRKQMVLQGVSFNVKRGEIYGLVGGNGTGKTTLLRILSGQIPKYSGKITLNNKTIKVGADINSPELFLNLSAFQNLENYAKILGKHNSDDIYRVMRQVSLERVGRKKVSGFSLGMKQRLKLAVTLLEEPDILILDEPTNGLDPDGIIELRKLLLELSEQKGMTIIITSHILGEVENLATTIGILSQGKILLQISKEELVRGEKSLEDIYRTYKTGGIY